MLDFVVKRVVFIVHVTMIMIGIDRNRQFILSVTKIACIDKMKHKRFDRDLLEPTC